MDPTRVVAQDNFYEFDGGEKVSGDRERDEDKLCFLLPVADPETIFTGVIIY